MNLLKYMCMSFTLVLYGRRRLTVVCYHDLWWHPNETNVNYLQRFYDVVKYILLIFQNTIMRVYGAWIKYIKCYHENKKLYLGHSVIIPTSPRPAAQSTRIFVRRVYYSKTGYWMRNLLELLCRGKMWNNLTYHGHLRQITWQLNSSTLLMWSVKKFTITKQQQ